MDEEKIHWVLNFFAHRTHSHTQTHETGVCKIPLIIQSIRFESEDCDLYQCLLKCYADGSRTMLLVFDRFQEFWTLEPHADH